jgi:hypothetical protein
MAVTTGSAALVQQAPTADGAREADAVLDEPEVVEELPEERAG